MKKMFLYFFTAVMAGALGSNAQPLAVGTTVEDIQLTDIKGNDISLYGYLDQGYTVLVDISATWCGPCWNFEKTSVGQTLYEKYGPEGTVSPGKIIFLFIEGDVRTNSADLNGTGRNTQGDWVTGKTHPIVDPTTSDAAIHFSVPGATSISFPTFLMICPDRKVVWNGAGFRADWNETFFVEKSGTCSASGTSIEEATLTLSSGIYPNPATDLIHLDLNAKEKTNATLTISNMLGQELLSEQITLLAGAQSRSVETASLTNGMYILTITTPEHTRIQHKFLKR